MDPQVILVLASLAKEALAAATAMQGASMVLQNNPNATLEDLKQFEIANERARDILVQAIDEAEE